MRIDYTLHRGRHRIVGRPSKKNLAAYKRRMNERNKGFGFRMRDRNR